MFLDKTIRTYSWLLRVIGTIALNALLLYVFFLNEFFFKISTVIYFVSAFLFMVLFNIILWRIGIFNKNESHISETVFREFIENINEVFWRATPDLSQVIYVSAAYDDIWGRSRENLFKNPNEWLESIVPEDQDRVKNTLLSLTQKNISNVKLEFSIKRPNGDLRNIYTRGFRSKNKNGALINILGISTDISTYKQEEQAKIILKDIKNILEHENHLASVVPKVLKIICIAYKWDFGEMWLVDKEKNVLRSISTWDNSEWDIATRFDEESQRITFRPGVILPGEMWKVGQLIWLENLDTIELVRMKEAAQAGFHSAVRIPIFINDNIIGVLDFFSRDIKKPNEITTNLLKIISEQVSLYIEKKHTEDQVIFVSRHDAQTFLLNQSALKDNLKKLLTTSTNAIAILLFEIDRFKLINSITGSETGDSLLKMVVDRLRKITPLPDDTLGRYETNVFALYLSFHLVEEVIEFSQAVLKLFKEPFFINQEYIYLTANIGITTNSDSGNDINTLFKHANLALDKSIKAGKNNVSFFSFEISNTVHDQLILEASLQDAFNNNEFCLYYQPKVNLITGEISGAEALVRWQHPVKGLLLPADFIWLAEETGLVIKLDELILREVFMLIKNDWPMNPNGNGLIAINISPLHFEAKNDIFSYIKNLMQEFNVNPKLIDIEITESVLLDESRYNLNVLNKLIDMGFNLSLDDFGTGFNSLNYLLRLPAHSVKIDKSFIDGLPNNKTSIAIVRAIIILCHGLDKKVIAEGVETREQAQFLKQEGCDEIQGYYFSRPVPINEFKMLIHEHKKLML